MTNLRPAAPLTTTALMLLAVTGMALARANIYDPKVRSWMDTMKAIEAEVKILRTMAKGTTPYDTKTENGALMRHSGYAAELPSLFEPKATDPISKARQLIWETWDDHVAKADALTKLDGETRISFPNELEQALRAPGQTCSAGHEMYRD